MKLNGKDLETLISLGCNKSDLPQIVSVAESNLVCYYKQQDYRKISEKTALKRLGRNAVLSGILRATFHMNGVVGNADYIVVVDAYPYYSSK